MSRTYKGSKGGGFDFWSRRPHSGNGHGPEAKKQTKRTERQQDRIEVENELNLIYEDKLDRQRQEHEEWLRDHDTYDYTPSYRLFLDDERYPTKPDWFIARTSYDAIHALENFGVPYEIAFDHDLGGSDTAMVFINALENYLIDSGTGLPPAFQFTVHSQNPVGAENIRQRMENLIEYFGFI